MAAATVLFHPDYTVGFGITPNLLTLPPGRTWEKALAGLGCYTLTAGGDFHPALRTRPPNMSGQGNYAEARQAQQAPTHGEHAAPP
jgi:hypothetical protein